MPPASLLHTPFTPHGSSSSTAHASTNWQRSPVQPDVHEHVNVCSCVLLVHVPLFLHGESAQKSIKSHWRS